MASSQQPPHGGDDENERTLEDYVASFFNDLADPNTTLPEPFVAAKNPRALKQEAMQAEKIAPKTAPLTSVLQQKKSVLKKARSPKPFFLSADQIPADIQLSVDQKSGLQKLLDDSIAQSLEKTQAVQAIDELTAAAVIVETTLEPNLQSLLAPPLPEPAIATVTALNTSKTTQDVDDEATRKMVELANQQDQCGTQNSVFNSNENVPLPDKKEAPTVDFRAHWQGNVPNYGIQKFEVLLFSCRGVTLAIPLMSLGYIYWQTQALNQFPNMPDWVIGVKPIADRKLKIMDAGAYFFPERAATLDTDANMHIISIADSDWAFAVDTVANPSKMEVADVQWRPLNRNNPWLAGAIKKHMCILIDPPALLLHLNPLKN